MWKIKKNFWRRFFLNDKFLAVIGLILLVLISIPLANNLKERRLVNRQIIELENEINSIEGKNSDLQKLIKYLGSDQYAEEQARLKMGLRKEGEQVAIIKEISGRTASENDPNPQAATAKYAAQNSGNPVKWWRYFFH